ncbi:GNAT family N-acetyltransferase [Orrella daihaiensis]|uniref:GNAT family N-acetyltransferase n=2 Tax=Orrella daihaiensis TaxID=2782176 RepID=A0ABY4AMY9_9BURK|nr:GNAT family N-acetyltransferase [Orrella daihaiensis]
MPWVIKPVDFKDERQVGAFLQLLDMYARDPMGGGEGLTEQVKARLAAELPNAGGIHLIAWLDDQAVGLLNAFMGYSTFKARALINVHDIAVDPDYRGQGVGQALLAELESIARARACCKLTLEVLSGNTKARKSYERFGFEDYALDPQMGVACFMQKWL